MNLRDILLAKAMGGGAVSPEQIDQAVESYLERNHVSGGGSEKWEHICYISVVYDEANPISKIEQDLGGDFRKIKIHINKDANGIYKTESDSYTWETYVNYSSNKDLVGRISFQLAGNGYCQYLFEIDWIEDINMYISRYSASVPTGGITPYVNNWRAAEPIRKLYITAGSFNTFTAQIYGVRY